MGWFDEQIKQRKKNDEDLFSEAFVGIALFCVAYLVQFFIDLDKNKAALEEASEDDTEDEENYTEDAIVNEDDEDEFDNSYDNEDDIK